MKKYFDIILGSPWKLTNELFMYLIKPFVFIYLKIHGVKVGKGFKFYGMPRIFKTRGSRIIIGDNFENRNWWFCNPLGINHPLILCTWDKNAVISIGDDVGISGGSIVANTKIEIGDNVLIGANSTIIDTDFHPTEGNKRYSNQNVKSKEVSVGDNVFIGMNVTVLKGVHISKSSVVPAGAVVR